MQFIFKCAVFLLVPVVKIIQNPSKLQKCCLLYCIYLSNVCTEQTPTNRNQLQIISFIDKIHSLHVNTLLCETRESISSQIRLRLTTLVRLFIMVPSYCFLLLVSQANQSAVLQVLLTFSIQLTSTHTEPSALQ